LNPAESALLFSTYLGGRGYDGGNGLALDSAGDIYVTGGTTSTDFPTINAVRATYAGGGEDGFVTKLQASGNRIVYSTYVGGTEVFPAGIALDPSGSAYVAATVLNKGFPADNPLGANLGGRDGVVLKLNAAGSAIACATFLGGSNDEFFYGLAVDSLGNAFVTGSTLSDDLPTANAMQSHCAGSEDAFVSSLDPAGNQLAYSTYLGGTEADWSRAITRSERYSTASAFLPDRLR
jgi:hypothetical protein